MTRRFLALRTATLLWGFGVSLVFTGSLVTAVPMFLVMAGGNTFIMWYFSK